MKKSPKHILIIPSWFQEKKSEFEVAPFIRDQIEGLQELGHLVNVFFPDFVQSNLREKLYLNKKYISTWNDSKLYHIKLYKRISLRFDLEKNYLLRKVESFFREYIKKEGKPDLIHAHSIFYGGVVSKYLSVKFEIPFIVTEHSSHFILNGKSLTTYDIEQIESVLNRSDKTIMVSRFQQEQMNQFFKLHQNNQLVIHNIVSRLFLNNIRKANEKIFTFICVGYFNYTKNHNLLLDAFKILIDREIKVNLVLVGDGVLRSELKKKIVDSNLNNFVRITGFIDRKTVCEELTKSSALVSSSRIETFGVNIIEGLAIGMPVVVVDSGGPKEIIKESNGIIVKNFDASELAEGMIKIMTSYSKYNQKEIKEQCAEKYCQEMISKEIDKIYDKIIYENHEQNN